MSILPSIGGVLSSLPDLSFCNNNNCSNSHITCCAGNRDEKFKLKSHNITEDYVSNKQYATFYSNSKGVIVKFANPAATPIADISLINLFVDTTCTERMNRHGSVRKLLLNDQYIVAEFKPRRDLLGKPKSCVGLIIPVMEDEWKAFQ